MQVLLRIAPNVFREGFSGGAVAACVTRLMEAQGLDPEGEAPGSLAAVEVAWWDHGGGAPGPVEALRQLDKLCQDETETDPDSGEVTVTAPRKIRALGVYDFPDACAAPRLHAPLCSGQLGVAATKVGVRASNMRAGT